YAPGLDTRGDGGYFVAPPSGHESGGRYAWMIGFGPDEVKLAPMPPWLLARVRGGGRTGSSAKASENPRPRFDMHAALAGVPEGQRDDTIYKLACKMRHLDIPIEMARDWITRAAEKCTPPFSVKEAAEKVDRAYR